MRKFQSRNLFVHSLALGAGLLLSLSAFAAPFTGVTVFGDSLSDIGNNRTVGHVDVKDQQLVQKPRPQGAPIVNPSLDGSRGKLWVDYFFELGVKRGLLRSGAAPIPSRQENVLLPFRSVDYAWASAVSMDGYADDHGQRQTKCFAPSDDPKHLCIPGMLKQISLFLHRHPKPDPQGLYVIWVGANDLGDYIQLGDSEDKIDDVLLRTANHIARGAQLLLNVGIPASHIAVVNLPDLAETPRAYEQFGPDVDDRGDLSALSDYFDQTLSVALNELRLPSGEVASILRIRTFELTDDLRYVPEHYSDYGYVASEKTVGRQCLVNPVAMKQACPGYMFYNGIHPSTQTNRVFAEVALQAIQEQLGS